MPYHPSENHPIAYFSAEYGLDDKLPIFAGGLGILAADLFFEAKDVHLPWVAVGLNYHQGFDTYRTQTSNQILNPTLAGFEIVKDDKNQPLLIDIEIGNHKVLVKSFVKSECSTKLYLLDTKVEANSSLDQTITDHLYDSNPETRLKQMMVLAFGGVKLLKILGITPVVYHLNEGQTALIPLALAQSLQQTLNLIKPLIVATKHTMLSGADLYFSKNQLREFLGTYFSTCSVDLSEVMTLAQDSLNQRVFSVSRFLLNCSVRASGVSKLHCQLEELKDPLVKLIPVTNGIYAKRWLSPAFSSLNFSTLSDEKIWQVHTHNKQQMLQLIAKSCRVNLDPNILTMVWARRFAGYKRPSLIFSDIQALAKLVNNQSRPIQLIIAGKASTADNHAKQIVEEILTIINSSQLAHKVCYLPDYSLQLAEDLVTGADVWLNTPEFGKEACGTSGMKSALNGVLQYSMADGWLAEVDSAKLGWILPIEAFEQNLYAIIKKEIIPTFYKRDRQGLPKEWILKMRSANKLITEQFLTSRVLQQYLSDLYFP